MNASFINDEALMLFTSQSDSRLPDIGCIGTKGLGLLVLIALSTSVYESS